MITIYAGVHRVMAPPFGPLIDVVTRLRFPGDRWVLRDGPATHAFNVVTDGGVCGTWRLDADADPLGATWARCMGPDGRLSFRAQSAVWRVGELPDSDRDWLAGLIGTAYDLSECLNQGVAVVNAAISVLPRFKLGGHEFGFPRIPVDYKSLEGACICTALTCMVMRRCGGWAERVADDVMREDFYPEELAQKLRSFEHALPRVEVDRG